MVYKDKNYNHYYLSLLKNYYYVFALFLLVLQNYILKNFNTGAIWNYLVSPMIYVTTFKVLTFIFEKWIWKLYMKPSLLSGKWYITFTGKEHVEIDSSIKEYSRYGELEVIWIKPLDINIIGSNYDYDSAKFRKWTGKVTSLKGTNIEYIYKVEKSISKKGENNKDGTFSGQIKMDNAKNQIIEIIGNYKDESGNNFGKTIWSRIPSIKHPKYQNFNKYET